MMWNQFFEKQHKSPVITDAKSLYDALERSESSTRNLTERRTAIEVTAIRNIRQLGSCMRSSLRENGKSFGTRLFRVPESSRWQNGQKAKEILVGDKFSMIILLYDVPF